MCVSGFSLVPALVLTFTASGFPQAFKYRHPNIHLLEYTALKEPRTVREGSSFEIHATEGSTHLSSFAGASEISLTYSVSSDDIEDSSFSANVLQSGLIVVPSFHLLLFFVSWKVWAVWVIPRARSCQVT